MKTTTAYDDTNPEHVRRQPLVQPGLIESFSIYLKIGDDIPSDGACLKKCYGPVSMRQTPVEIDVMGSRKRDVRFPEKDTTFSVGR